MSDIGTHAALIFISGTGLVLSNLVSAWLVIRPLFIFIIDLSEKEVAITTPSTLLYQQKPASPFFMIMDSSHYTSSTPSCITIHPSTRFVKVVDAKGIQIMPYLCLFIHRFMPTTKISRKNGLRAVCQVTSLEGRKRHCIRRYDNLHKEDDTVVSNVFVSVGKGFL